MFFPAGHDQHLRGYGPGLLTISALTPAGFLVEFRPIPMSFFEGKLEPLLETINVEMVTA